MRRRALAVVWALGLVALVWAPVWGAAVALPYGDDFETLAVGVYPALTGWTRASTGQFAAISNLASYSGAKSFRLGSLPWSTRTDYLTLSAVPEQLAYQAAVRADASYGRVGRVGFVAGAASPTAIWNYFQVDARTQRLGFQGATWVDLGSYTPGDWVVVSANLDYEDLVADLWLNGQLVYIRAPIVPMTFADPTLGAVTLNRFGINCPSNSTGSDKYQGNIMYFDVVQLWEWEKTIPVNVDIRPDCYPNVINLGSKGVVPVAIFGGEGFDVTEVDVGTVRLAGAPIAVRGKGKYLAQAQDLNGDGWLDLVIHVETEQIVPEELQDGYAAVSGALWDGGEFAGQDEVVVVPSE